MYSLVSGLACCCVPRRERERESSPNTQEQMREGQRICVGERGPACWGTSGGKWERVKDRWSLSGVVLFSLSCSHSLLDAAPLSWMRSKVLPHDLHPSLLLFLLPHIPVGLQSSSDSLSLSLCVLTGWLWWWIFFRDDEKPLSVLAFGPLQAI